VRFWLGAPEPAWLTRTDLPLCVSRSRLIARKTLPRAKGPVFLDSGGFSELTLHDGWTVPAPVFAAQVRTICAGIGNVQHAAIQDWMTEPHMLAKTGLTLKEHQRRTVASYRDLLALAPDLPWLPVLQGWHQDDYLRHLGDYARAGFDLTTLPLVGVGSVCRRQHTNEAEGILRTLAGEGLHLHAFGFKVQGLANVADALTSADSMAWSFQARRLQRPTCGSTTHKNCANCLVAATRWYAQVVAQLGRQETAPRQLSLWDVAA
jgi:hypothetical protein